MHLISKCVIIKKVICMDFFAIPIIEDCILNRFSSPKQSEVFVTGRNFCSLSYRTKGKVRIRGAGADLISGEGSLTFVPAGYSYYTEIIEEEEKLLLHFFTREPCGGTPMVVDVPSAQVVRELFENTIQRYRSRGSDLRVRSMVYQLLAEAEGIFFPSKMVPPVLKKSKRRMDEELTDPALRIRELAEECGMSEVWFRQEFTKYYGQSPLEYIKGRRIERAKILLQTGIYTVTDVAFRTGFESSSYFSAEFRRMTGDSPREYMKKCGGEAVSPENENR